MITYLTEEIEAICPIHGINSDGDIFFKDEATEDQKTAAAAKYKELTSVSGLAAYEVYAARKAIKDQILEIEREQIMPRKTREIQIQVMEYFATTQGVTKEQLYLVNPAYKGMVDVDSQIKALRALL